MSVESVASEIRKKMRARAIKAARLVQRNAKKRLSEKKVVPRSLPGEYPRMETGKLTQSVETFASTDGLEYDIAPTAEYAKYLMDMDRKMMPEVLAESAKEVRRL